MKTASPVKVVDLGNKEEKTVFPVVSWSDVHFSFLHLVFCVPHRAHKWNYVPKKSGAQK